jgi:hypothetical protein
MSFVHWIHDWVQLLIVEAMTFLIICFSLVTSRNEDDFSQQKRKADDPLKTFKFSGLKKGPKKARQK